MYFTGKLVICFTSKAYSLPPAWMNTGARIGRAVQRVLGTAVGLVLTYAILVITLVPWQMIAVIAVLQFLVEMFVTRQYSLAQVFVTPLALMSSELTGAQPANILFQDRALETLIGSLIGITVVAAMHYADQARATAAKPIILATG